MYIYMYIYTTRIRHYMRYTCANRQSIYIHIYICMYIYIYIYIYYTNKTLHEIHMCLAHVYLI